MNAVILGASKGIGRAVARRLAGRGDRLFLLGRDASGLEADAADLTARGAPAPISVAACDLLRPGGFSEALDEAWLFAIQETPSPMGFYSYNS